MAEENILDKTNKGSIQGSIKTDKTTQKTILDSLAREKKLDLHLVEEIRKNCLSNQAVESEVKKRGLCSSEDIAKAYSEFFNLPIVKKEEMHPRIDYYHDLPKELSEKYGVLIYDKQVDPKTGKNIYKVAVSQPGELRPGGAGVFAAIHKKTGYIVKLAITTPEDLTQAKKVLIANMQEVKKEENNSNVSNNSSVEKPVLSSNSSFTKVDLKNKRIPYKVLARFPLEVSKKYRMVVFDMPEPTRIKVALEDPNNSQARDILNFIHLRNKVEISKYLIEKEQLDEILNYYEHREKDEKKEGISGTITGVTDSKLNDQKPVEVKPSLPAQPKSELKPQNQVMSQHHEHVQAQPINSMSQHSSPINQSQPVKVVTNPPSSVPLKKILQPQTQPAAQKSAVASAENSPKTEEKHEGFLSKLMSFSAKKPEKIDEVKQAVPEEKKEEKKAVINIHETHAAKEMEKQQIEERTRQLETLAALGGKKNAAPKGSAVALTEESQKHLQAKEELKKQEQKVERAIADQTSGIEEEAERDRQIEEMKKLESELAKRSESDIGDLLNEDVDTTEKLKEIISSASIPKIIAAILNYALFKRASDIHIEPTEKEVRVRYRIDGILYDIASAPRYFRNALVSRVKILSKLKIDEQRVPQDGRFTVVYQKKEVDLRISSLPTVNGETVAIRILDKSRGVLSMEELGITGSNFDKLSENIDKPYGVIASCGPTGSGKTTSLYAVLNRVSTPAVNVITLEDPVEYEIAGINQCQVKPKIGFSFAEGLRSVLRQDPNVIMVGEVRDSETANMVTHAALTGHLVLTTLHTNDASGALPRLINMGVEPFLITSSVNCIIGQRLVRRICPKCKEEVEVHSHVEEALRKKLDNIKDTKDFPKDLEFKFYKGKGCPDCHMGYHGRIGIFEVLAMSPEIEDLAIKRFPDSAIKVQAIKEGMITMEQDGLLKAIRGITTLDEVFRATST